MADERKPSIKEWAKIRARQRKLEARSFRFWYETNSSSVIATEVMGEAEALEWLASNQQLITSMLISERMTSKEAYVLLNRSDDEDDGVM